RGGAGMTAPEKLLRRSCGAGYARLRTSDARGRGRGVRPDLREDRRSHPRPSRGVGPSAQRSAARGVLLAEYDEDLTFSAEQAERVRVSAEAFVGAVRVLLGLTGDR